MSWFTLGEIVVWLVLAAALGMVLGWLLHERWNRRLTAEVSRAVSAAVEQVDEPPVRERIKGKRSSGIYHVPGSPAYARTNADVWFDTEDEAVAAGFRPPRNR
jgi:type VI protein secretion system component VasK